VTQGLRRPGPQAPRTVPQTRIAPSAHALHRNAALLKRALEGDLALALKESVSLRRGWGERTTSLAEDMVREWLDHRGLRVRSKAVTRILCDHVPEDLQRPERSRELLKAEKRLSSKEPFASLGQHAHLVCERSGVWERLRSRTSEALTRQSWFPHFGKVWWGHVRRGWSKIWPRTLCHLGSGRTLDNERRGVIRTTTGRRSTTLRNGWLLATQ
jgi:hypothetical protein